MLTDEEYMQLALKEAHLAATNDEVPVGAVITDINGQVLAIAHNTCEHGDCAIQHAEILALEQASKKLNQVRLWDCTLYVTLEPCAMCAAAISLMRIKRLVYGAKNPKDGAVDNGVCYFNNATCHHKPIVTSGILEQESADLLRQFFAHKR